MKETQKSFLTKARTFLEFLFVISVMIMGFNQTLITVLMDIPYDLLDAMTIGSGLFLLSAGIVNIYAMYDSDISAIKLAVIINVLAIVYQALINFPNIHASSPAALIPFVGLVILQIHRIRKRPLSPINSPK